MAEDSGTASKILLTGIVIILMIPGLIIEPGPLSEVIGLGAILSIWGIDWDGQ